MRTGTGIGFFVGIAVYLLVFVLAALTEDSDPAFNGLAMLVAGGLGALVGYVVKVVRSGYTRRGVAAATVERFEDETGDLSPFDDEPPPEVPSPRCPSCGKPNPVTKDRCIQCGQLLPGEAAPPPPLPPPPS